MKYRHRALLCLVTIATASAMTPSAFAQGNFVNFETPQVHPIDLSPDLNTLAVCNTADNRIELFNVSTGVPAPIGSISVGVDPVTVRFHSNTEIWVVNNISDSISIVDLTVGETVRTVNTMDEPSDVVFAGTPEMAFVSCSRPNTVQRFDPSNLDTAPTNIDIQGDDPRAMAVSPDGTKVYVAIFNSGNSSTIIAGGALPGSVVGFPQNTALTDGTNPYGGVYPFPNDPNDTKHPDGQVWFPPLNNLNPPPPKVGLIVKKDPGGAWRDDNGADWSPWVSGIKANESGRFNGWDIVDHDIAIISNLNAGSPTVAYADRLMNINMAIAVNPATGEVTTVGTDGTNEIRFEPVIGGRFLRVEVSIVDGSNPLTKSVVDLNHAHLAAAQPGHVDPYETGTIPQSERDKSIGDPRAIVWNSSGTRGYITGMGSNNVVAVQANGERIAPGAKIDVQEGPTGLALDNTNGRLYVLNRFHASVSVISTGTDTVTADVPFFDPTPGPIKIGRKHLYDTHKNSGLGHIACGSCHVDGRMDRLAWDLGDPSGAMKPLNGQPGEHNLGGGLPGLDTGFLDFHPMKGPMTTQTLQDIIGKEPFHWRGDRDGLGQFNGAFMTLQGDNNNLSPVEMQQYEDFLASIHIPPNPFRNFDNTLPTNLPLPGEYATGNKDLSLGTQLPNGNAVNGLALFRDLFGFPADNPFGCVACHTLPIGDGTDTHFNGVSFAPLPAGPLGEHHVMLVSVDGSTNKAIKVPQLRNQIHKTGFQLNSGHPSTHGFGVLHDGSIDTLARFVSEPAFPNVDNDQKVADLVALLFSFSGGFSFVTPNPAEPPGQMSKDAPASVGKQTTLDSGAKDAAAVNAMLALANAHQVDVIAKGELAGSQRGWFYIGGGQWISDHAADPPISTATLLSLAGPGAEITVTVVPFGTGFREGVDRDNNLVLDFDQDSSLVPTISIWGIAALVIVIAGALVWFRRRAARPIAAA